MVQPSVFVGQRKNGLRALWWVLRVLPKGEGGHDWQCGTSVTKDSVDMKDNVIWHSGHITIKRI